MVLRVFWLGCVPLFFLNVLICVQLGVPPPSMFFGDVNGLCFGLIFCFTLLFWRLLILFRYCAATVLLLSCLNSGGFCWVCLLKQPLKIILLVVSGRCLQDEKFFSGQSFHVETSLSRALPYLSPYILKPRYSFSALDSNSTRAFSS